MAPNASNVLTEHKGTQRNTKADLDFGPNFFIKIELQERPGGVRRSAAAKSQVKTRRIMLESVLDRF